MARFPDLSRYPGMPANFKAVNKQEFTATTNQSVFTITNGSYVVGSKTLEVVVKGITQPPSAYTETSATSFTLSEPVPAGTRVVASWLEGKLPVAFGHKSSHELGGQDELDVTKLKNYKERVGVNVKDFGAKGDGVTDDWKAIQDALDYVKANGGGRVYVPNGKYLIGTKITIPSFTYFYGESQNAEMLASNALYAMFTMNDADNTTVTTLTINGRSKERDTAGTLTKAVYGLSMSRAQNCLITNVKFVNLGYKPQTYSEQALSMGGNMLDMAADDDMSNGRDTKNNVIEGCLFIDDEGRSSFGIRMWTSWEIEPAQRKYYVRANTLRNNYFKGFNWNSVELAGPGCVHNKLEGNVGEDHYGYSVFEADKGASYNVYTNNIVRNLIVTGTMSKYAYRDARGATTAGGYNYYATGNVWDNNIAENVTQGGTTTSGGMLLYGSRNAVITNLSIKNIQRDPTNTTVDNVAAIVLDDAENATISTSNLTDSRLGIYIMAAKNVEFYNNNISNCAFGVKTATTGIENNSFKGNKIHDIVSTGINLNTSNLNTNIINNTIYNCNKGIVTNASTTFINGNILYNITDSSNGIDARGGTNIIMNNTLRACRLYLDGTGVNNVVFNNTSDLSSDNYSKKIFYGSAPPTTGTWGQGDICYNNKPVAGAFVGWVCITGGTSGTWKGFGLIEA